MAYTEHPQVRFSLSLSIDDGLATIGKTKTSEFEKVAKRPVTIRLSTSNSRSWNCNSPM